jgi:hypothetical protein
MSLNIAQSKETPQMTTKKVGQITEEQQYSEAFAEMILEQNSPEHLTEIDVDSHLADLDRMIAEAKLHNGKATKH